MFVRFKLKNTPCDHEQLFDYQLITLEKRNCPPAIIQAFKGARKKVLAHALSLTEAEDHVSFVPVITPCHLGYHGLIGLLRHNKMGGIADCEADRISDLEKVPERLYYIFGVEDGTEWFDLVPEVSHILICQEKRLPATTAEAISIAIHSDVLGRHSLVATGSRYASDRTPIICLNVVWPDADRSALHPANPGEYGASLLKSELGRPSLGWWYSDSPSHGGAPSCTSRLEI